MNKKISRNSKFYKHFDDSRPDFTPYGFTCELWTAREMPRADRHNEIELNFLYSGSLTYLLGGHRETVEHGRLTMFWGALPHQILNYETRHPYHVVTLPLASFLNCRLPGTLVRPILDGKIVTDPEEGTNDMEAFKRWFDDLQSGNPLREQVAEMEIHARLLRLALALPGRKVRNRQVAHEPCVDPSLTRADHIACYIARNYMQPLTADQIAHAVGLHPNYAMTLFRKTFGSTITEFLLQHRLSHAQRLLVTTDRSITEVGEASGFQSLSRFNEFFKEACNCPPREYRKAHQEALQINPSHTRVGSEKRLSSGRAE